MVTFVKIIFVTVVAEKASYLQDILQSIDIKVMGFYGNKSINKFDSECDVAVCTIEKANSLINKLLENNQLEQIGIIVIDEIHMMSDPDRGYILELLVTKILYRAPNIQIVGLSATLPNIQTFEKWLNAALFVSDFRPVQLEEYYVLDNTVYNKNSVSLRKIDKINGMDDGLATLCNETLLQNASVLVFCPTKRNCET